MNRPKAWKKWDALHKALWPHQARFVKAAYREADKIFGLNWHKNPAKRLAIQSWIMPTMGASLGLVERDAASDESKEP